MITDVKVEFAAPLIHIFLNGNAVIDSNWPDWQVEPKTDADIRDDVVRVEIPGSGIHVARIVENGRSRFFDDRNRVFHGKPGERPTPKRLAGDIPRTNIVKIETAQII